jgi:hypothetical protein
MRLFIQYALLVLNLYMPDVNQPSNRSKNIFKRILSVIGTGGLLLGIAIIFIRVPPSCGCGDSSKGTVGSFIRAQQAYFFEKSTFAQSYRLLDLGDGDAPTATHRYRYTVDMTKDKSFIYATPIKELPTDIFQLGLTKQGFHSLIGAVAYEPKNKTTISIMCRSEKQTLNHPPQPIFKQGKFSCPIGFKTIK